MIKPYNTAAEERLAPTCCSSRPALKISCRVLPQAQSTAYPFSPNTTSHPIPSRISLCVTPCPGQVVPPSVYPCGPAYPTLPKHPQRETLRNFCTHLTSLCLLSELRSPKLPLPTGKWRPQYELSATCTPTPAVPSPLPLRGKRVSPEIASTLPNPPVSNACNSITATTLRRAAVACNCVHPAQRPPYQTL